MGTSDLASGSPVAALSPTGQPVTRSSFLGATIEEKTRRILGWTDGFSPPPSSAPQPQSGSTAASCRRVERCGAKRRQQQPSTVASPACAPYPYSLLNSDNRVRKTSTGSDSGQPAFFRQQMTPPASPAYQQQQQNFQQHCFSALQPSATVGLLPPPPYHCVTSAVKYGSGPTLFPGLQVSPVSPVNCVAAPVSPHMQQKTPRESQSACVNPKELFERLRLLMPSLQCTEQSRYHTLMKAVALTIELEARLAALQHETQQLDEMLQHSCAAGKPPAAPHSAPPPPKRRKGPPAASRTRSDPSLAAATPASAHPLQQAVQSSAAVPDDLLSIDVSAFRTLVSQPSPVLLDAVDSLLSSSFAMQLPLLDSAAVGGHAMWA